MRACEKVPGTKDQQAKSKDQHARLMTTKKHMIWFIMTAC